LDSPRVIAAIQNLTREPASAPAVIHLPTLVLQGESARSLRPPLAGGSPAASSIIDLQSRIRSEFTQWFSKGYAATAIRFTPSGSDYCLSPWSDF